MKRKINRLPRKTFLPPFRPSIGASEIKEVVDTLKSDWITTGPKVKIFEERLKKYLGAKHVLAVNSCTSALHLSLVALEIGKDDEVILPSLTFVSSANVILYQGAKPVFADIEKDSLTISPKEIEKKITKKTKAILPVHYAGQSCKMGAILKIAKKHNLKVIEDAAHAIGSKYEGKKIGMLGDTTCFSFYATKNITTGEGGAIATNNDYLAEKLKILRLHGMSKDAWKRYSSIGSWYYEIRDLGYKYNMTDIQASLGIHQLKKLDKFINKKQIIAEKYTKALESFPEIIIPKPVGDIRHSWHLYPLQLNNNLLKIKRNEFIEALKFENIGTSVHFIPLHLQPLYKNKYGFKKGDFPNTEEAYERIISLPIYPKMNRKDVEDVIAAVKKVIINNRIF